MSLDLATVKLIAIAQVDSIAEGVRRLFIPGAIQAVVYFEKSEEAADYIAAGYPSNVSAYPHIASEATATSQTPTAVANGIIAKKTAWIAASAQVEGIRMSAKININNATTPEAVQAIIDTAATSLSAITP